jgi:phosphoribosylformylglycinamidine cyclo-ligase
VVDADKVIDGKAVRIGDLVYGFESSGLHSNGYSLARRILMDKAGLALKARVPGLRTTLGKLLLTPTKIYCRLVAEILKRRVPVSAFAHITGGGIPGNLNRVLPKKVDARVELGTWQPHPVFKLIAETGPVSQSEMLKTFNMGLGFMAVAPASSRSAIERIADAVGEKVHVVGSIVAGKGNVSVV